MTKIWFEYNYDDCDDEENEGDDFFPWSQLASQSQQNDIQYKPPMFAEGMVQYHVCSV